MPRRSPRFVMSVPKVIVHTHAPDRPEDCHEWAREAMAEAVRNNPSFTHAYYGDAACLTYIKRTMPEVLPTYLAINERHPQARADFFRYIRIYQEGGVYLDSTCCLTRPLEEIVAMGQMGDRKKAVLTHWGGLTRKGNLFCPWKKMKGIPERGEFVNFCLIAPARHPLFKRVVEAVVREVSRQIENPKKRVHGKYGVLRTTGPILFTREAVKFYSEGGEDWVAIHESIEDLGVKYNKAWPRLKWAMPHRKEEAHYGQRHNRKVLVVVQTLEGKEFAEVS